MNIFTGLQHNLQAGWLYLQLERKMSASSQTYYTASYFRKLFSALLMSGCLLFLTGANFVVYATFFFSKHSSTVAGENSREAPAPVEENTSTCKLPVVQEEYLHERDCLKEFALLTLLSQRHISDADKLQVVHYELESPPPKV